MYVILDYGYGRDQCTDEAFEKETLELHGCTAPFGPHKDKICDDEKNATKVNDLYKKWYSKSIQVTSGCNKPCSYVTLRTNMIFDREKYHNTIARVQIYFKENITVTKAYHIYTMGCSKTQPPDFPPKGSGHFVSNFLLSAGILAQYKTIHVSFKQYLYF